MKVRAVLAAITLAGSTLGLAGTAAAEDEHANKCEYETWIHIWKTGNIHKPGDADHYKSGPGGSIDISQIKNGSTSTTVSGTGDVGVDLVVVSAKAQVDSTVNKTTGWSSNYTFHHDIPGGKFGHTQFGSWGIKTSFDVLRQNTDCSASVIDSGTSSMARKAKGFRWWVTKI